MGYRQERRKKQIVEQLGLVKREFLQSQGSLFGNLLDTRLLLRLIKEECGQERHRIFSTIVTLWAFLTQILDIDHSCRKAVARVVAWRTQKGLPKCSANTAAYCRARQRLPEALLRRLLQWIAKKLIRETPAEWLWKGRRVKIPDGTMVSMPDSEANQEEYPQQRRQKKGLGFPIARLVAVFDLATGSVMDVAMGKFRGGKSEKGLLQEIFENVFERGDVVIGDRHFAGYCDIAFSMRHGVDFVFRQHQARKTDFRRGKRLGPSDHLVEWTRPKQRPRGFDKDLFKSLPKKLLVREFKFEVERKGFRTTKMNIFTSFLSPEEMTREELAELLRMRWDVELNLRSIKTVMQMDILRCKTPEMVRKEIYAHLIVYNLIRGVMAQSANENQIDPLTISFKGAMQTLDANIPQLLLVSARIYMRSRKDILDSIGQHRVRIRPNRYEPRAVKRRPKPYPLLMQERHLARKKLEKKRA